jgi:integrase/recombinase XerD
MLAKQAKVLSKRELQRLLDHVSHSRHPERDRVIVLLSFHAGLRAKEIAALRWTMVLDPSGNLSDKLALPDIAAKGNSGREINLSRDLRAALAALMTARPEKARPDWQVAYSERGGYSGNSIAVWFYERFRELGIEGASSHSGRRSFITRAARKIIGEGGSLRDVQKMAGHTSLATTQRYIEGDSEAQRKVVDRLWDQ